MQIFFPNGQLAAIDMIFKIPRPCASNYDGRTVATLAQKFLKIAQFVIRLLSNSLNITSGSKKRTHQLSISEDVDVQHRSEQSEKRKSEKQDERSTDGEQQNERQSDEQMRGFRRMQKKCG